MWSTEMKPGLSDSCKHNTKDQEAVNDLSNKQPTIMSATTTREESNDWRRKAEQLETELRPLLKENQRLRRCLGGVKVLGQSMSFYSLLNNITFCLHSVFIHIHKKQSNTNNKQKQK